MRDFGSRTRDPGSGAGIPDPRSGISKGRCAPQRRACVPQWRDYAPCGVQSRHRGAQRPFEVPDLGPGFRHRIPDPGSGIRNPGYIRSCLRIPAGGINDFSRCNPRHDQRFQDSSRRNPWSDQRFPPGGAQDLIKDPGPGSRYIPGSVIRDPGLIRDPESRVLGARRSWILDPGSWIRDPASGSRDPGSRIP